MFEKKKEEDEDEEEEDKFIIVQAGSSIRFLGMDSMIFGEGEGGIGVFDALTPRSSRISWLYELTRIGKRGFF